MCTWDFLLFPPGYLSFHPVSWSKAQDILGQSGQLEHSLISSQTERNLSSLWSGILNPHRTEWGVASSLHTNRGRRIFWVIMLWKSGACDLFPVQFYWVLVWFSPPHPTLIWALWFPQELYKEYSKIVHCFPSPALNQIGALSCSHYSGLSTENLKVSLVFIFPLNQSGLNGP